MHGRTIKKKIDNRIARTNPLVTIDPENLTPHQAHLMGHLFESHYRLNYEHPPFAEFAATNAWGFIKYNVIFPDLKNSNRVIHQSFYLKSSIWLAPLETLDPLLLTEERYEQLKNMLENSNNSTITANQIYLFKKPHPTQADTIIFSPTSFTKNIYLSHNIILSFDSLSIFHAKMLHILLEKYGNRNFLDKNIGGKPYSVMYADRKYPERITYRSVTLRSPLIRYARKKNPAEFRYALYNENPIAKGGEGSIHLSNHTLKLALKNNKVSRFFLKEKSAVKSRIVKLYSRPYVLGDKRPLVKSVAREASFLKLIPDFHHKNSIFSRTNERAGLIMRKLPGKDLCDIDGYNTCVKKSLKLTIMICEAILAVHKLGIIHRDIKPENIMVELDKMQNPISVKIIDFGLAKLKDEKLYDCCGTDGYAAPEVYARKLATEKSDAYSLCRILTVMWADVFQNKKTPLPTEIAGRILLTIAGGLANNPRKRLHLVEILQLFVQMRDDYLANTDTIKLRI